MKGEPTFEHEHTDSCYYKGKLDCHPLHKPGCPKAHPQYPVGCDGCTCGGDTWHELTQDEMPSHLRDDAPTQQCGRCRRFTWSPSEFGQECRMTQPDGFPCGGRFR
jgi:hypothetical protein